MSFGEDKAPNCNIKLSHDIIHIENQKFVHLDIQVENLGTGSIKIKKARIFLNEGLITNDDIQFDDLRAHQKNVKIVIWRYIYKIHCMCFILMPVLTKRSEFLKRFLH